MILADFRDMFLDDGPKSLGTFSRRGTIVEFDLASAYCASADEFDRATGAYALGQLGLNDGGTFVDESMEILSQLVNDESDDVRVAVAWSLGAREQVRAVPHLATLAGAADPDVRASVAASIYHYDIPEAHDVLIRLCMDPDLTRRLAN